MDGTLTRPFEMTLEAIKPPGDSALVADVQRRLDSLTKPQGSLGRLEELALWYCTAHGTADIEQPKMALCVFCADHGVAGEGISAYPSDVTRQMALNFASGGAAINVLCRQAGIEATIVDVGVDSEPFDPPIRNEKIGRGTRSILAEPAMCMDQACAAIQVGIRMAAEAVDNGATLVAAGEMGIGSTTAAAAVAVALTGLPAVEVVGHGTGVDSVVWRKKVQVVSQSVSARRPSAADPLDVLAKLGGFEIAAMAGYYLGAAARRIPVIVDGFIASAAALAAMRLTPALQPYLLWSHLSAERGHLRLLEEISSRPLLELNLRLGEGTGAALAMDLVNRSIALYREMATFDSAGVSRA